MSLHRDGEREINHIEDESRTISLTCPTPLKPSRYLIQDTAALFDSLCHQILGPIRRVELLPLRHEGLLHRFFGLCPLPDADSIPVRP